MSYKYRKIPPNKDVVFAEVIKPAVWFGGNSIQYNDKPYPDLPVGAITWINASSLKKYNGKFYIPLNESVLIENNRYGWNFEPSCFELLHTTIKKVRK